MRLILVIYKNFQIVAFADKDGEYRRLLPILKKTLRIFQNDKIIFKQYSLKQTKDDRLFDIDKVEILKSIKYYVNSRKSKQIKLIETLPLFSPILSVCSLEATRPNENMKLSRNFSIFTGWNFKELSDSEYNESKAQTILDHFKILSNGQQTIYDFLLDLLAFIIQNPMKKTELMCLFSSHLGGTGKSSFAKLLFALLGSRNCLSISGLDRLLAKFNSHLMGISVLFIEELKGNSKDEYIKNLNDLKNIIDNPTLIIEKKNVDSFQIRSCFSIFGFSNYSYIMSCRDGGLKRRIFMSYVSQEKKNDINYFDKFYKAIEDSEALNNFGSYLMRRKHKPISELRAHHPDSELKNENILYSIPSIERCLYIMLSVLPEETDEDPFICMQDVYNVAGLFGMKNDLDLKSRCVKLSQYLGERNTAKRYLLIACDTLPFNEGLRQATLKWCRQYQENLDETLNHIRIEKIEQFLNGNKCFLDDFFDDGD